MYRDDAAALAARRDALARELEQTEQMLDELRGVRRRLPVLPTRPATRCNARWEDMRGDDRVRSCDTCKKNVYNFSEMTREEAETLMFEREGRLCARYYERADGSILLGDCWIGAQRWRRLKTVALAAATTVGGAFVARAFVGELQDIHDREITEPVLITEDYTLGRTASIEPGEEDTPPDPNAGEWIVTEEYGRVWRPSAPVDEPPKALEVSGAWLERMEGPLPTKTDALPKPAALDALYTRMHRR